MAVVFQGIEGEKKGRMVIGCASVLRLGHGNTKTLLSFFPNNIGAKHFLRAKTLNSSNLTGGPHKHQASIEDLTYVQVHAI